MFVFSIQSSVYSTTSVVKASLFSTWMRCTVSFVFKRIMLVLYLFYDQIFLY